MKNASLTSSICWGFSSAEELKDVMCIPLGGTRPCPKAALLFLYCSFLVCASPPFPDEQVFESAFWNSGKVMEAEAHSPKIKKWGTQKGLCAWEPHKALLGFIEQLEVLERYVTSNQEKIEWSRPSDTLRMGPQSCCLPLWTPGLFLLNKDVGLDGPSLRTLPAVSENV